MDDEETLLLAIENDIREAEEATRKLAALLEDSALGAQAPRGLVPQGEEPPVKVHNVIVYTGYAETCSWGCLVLHHPEGFITAADALASVARAFLMGFVHSEGREPEGQELMDLIREVVGGLSHEGGDFWDELQASGWEVSNHAWSLVFKDLSQGWVVLSEWGEYVLAAMVEHWEKSKGMDSGIIYSHGSIDRGDL